MPDEDASALILSGEQPTVRSHREIHKLSIERVERTVERVIQNRMKKMDRYNSLSIFRESDKPNTTRVLPGDTPDIQSLFQLRALYDEAAAVEDPEKRIRLRDSIMGKITTLCDRLEEQNGKIVQELQELLERDAEAGGNREPSQADLLKEAGAG